MTIVVHDPSDLEPAAGRAVAIGNFDGVHRGHREVLAAIRRCGLRSTVVTFGVHPRIVLGQHVAQLCSLPRRLELLGEAGVDEIVVLPFDAEMAALDPEQWVDRYLRPMGTRVIAVGRGFRFGHRRAGDEALLRRLGFEVLGLDVAPGVSSTRVRELIGRGELTAAARLLGRYHELDVEVLDVEVGARGTRVELTTSAPNAALPPAGAYVAGVAGLPGVCTATLRRPTRRSPRLSLRSRGFAGSAGSHLQLILLTSGLPRRGRKDHPCPTT